MKSFFNTVTIPYVIYLMYFLGVGFLSGAIVHYPVNPVLYGTIGTVGAVIFTLASTLNEWITNKRHLLQAGVAKVVFYSLILSIGLGMISGGIQHFIDFPVYASYLIPIGFVVSLIGYILNKEINLNSQHKLILIAKLSLISIPLFFLLNYFSHQMNLNHNDGHSHGAKKVVEKQETSHMMEVKNDKDFIISMIPHHQEAVDVSEIIVKRTQNPEVKKVAQEIVNVQKKEIEMMKKWLKDWYGEDYSNNTSYQTMMKLNYENISIEDIDSQYYLEMIAHHEGAIDMAEQIQAKTDRKEIKEFANAIITTQAKEVEMMKEFVQKNSPEAIIEDNHGH